MYVLNVIAQAYVGFKVLAHRESMPQFDKDTQLDTVYWSSPCRVPTSTIVCSLGMMCPGHEATHLLPSHL